MRREQSVESNGEVELPVVWGPRTRARAAAPIVGFGTGAGGVAALGCSFDTHPRKVLARSLAGLRSVLSWSQREFVGVSWSGKRERDKSSSGGATKLVSGLVSGVARGDDRADCRGSGVGRRCPDMRRRESAH